MVWSATRRDARLRAQLAGGAIARSGTALHQAGCMLFWAEGSKSTNKVVFVNSDIHMMRFFLRFLRECYAIDDRKISLNINCHLGNGLTLRQIEEWWLRHLGLPDICLRGPVVNRPSRASKRVRPQLPYGTARLMVHSTDVVQSIYAAIQEYGSFERPEWLEHKRTRPNPPAPRHAHVVPPPTNAAVAYDGLQAAPEPWRSTVTVSAESAAAP